MNTFMGMSGLSIKLTPDIFRNLFVDFSDPAKMNR